MKNARFVAVLIIVLNSIFGYAILADTYKLPDTIQSKSNDQFGSDFNTISSFGIGSTAEQALDKAFESAIEQIVGIVISSENIVENNITVRDEIMSVSNGYINSYKILNNTQKDGLFIIEIEADVKTQKVYEKMKSLNINISKLDTQEIQNIYSRIKTKSKTKEEVSKLLEKMVNNFLKKENIQEMIELKILNVSFEEDYVKDKKVPVFIEYELSIKYDAYAQKIAEIEQTFRNLGIEEIEGVQYKEFDGSLKDPTNKRINIPKNTHIGIAKIVETGLFSKKKQYKVNVWSFPESWGDIFPFNGLKSGGNYRFNELFVFSLIVKNKNGSEIINNTYKDIKYLDDLFLYSIKNDKVSKVNWPLKNAELSFLLAEDLISYGKIHYRTGWLNNSKSRISFMRFIAPYIDINFDLKDKFTGLLSFSIPIDAVHEIGDIILEIK